MDLGMAACTQDSYRERGNLMEWTVTKLFVLSSILLFNMWLKDTWGLGHTKKNNSLSRSIPHNLTLQLLVDTGTHFSLYLFHHYLGGGYPFYLISVKE